MKYRICRGVLTSALLVVTAFSQEQISYSGSNVTGQLMLIRSVNVMQLAREALERGTGLANVLTSSVDDRNVPTSVLRRFGPPVVWEEDDMSSGGSRRKWASSRDSSSSGRAAGVGSVVGLPVIANVSAFGFPGLTHADQRLANRGNQFNVEPPNPSIAVSNGLILQGVNNAIQVFTVSGTPVLPKVLSSNELFGVPAAIDRATGINGVFPTDMRVFHDHSINRWFVIQRAQDYDLAGNTLPSSRMFIAVSRSPDPTGIYNIYSIETTDAARSGCPCVADYPQIGADQYGLFISTGEYNVFGENFVSAQIHVISKSSLAAGTVNPTTYRFVLPFTTGFEFAIQPATTPPGAQYFSGNNGLEYLVSTYARGTSDSNMAVFAVTNTSSLGTESPNLTLTQRIVPVIPYTVPDVASQRLGPLPYASTLSPPGSLAFLDGGDARVQALSYAGGRLYVSLATQVADETGRQVVGGAYIILSPTFRSGVLAAPVFRQGYFGVKNNHLLRSGIAMNAQGRGAIAATLVGPDYYPSAVYLPLDLMTGPSSVQLVGPGSAPQDGFTGYPGGFGAGVARWGDYTTAVVADDGGFWSTAEYIPNSIRTERANWGAFVSRYVP